jgi:predicted PhzF superfamily epimerase YddE/YHI9
VTDSKDNNNNQTTNLHVVSYKQGSGNPAAVVLVPNVANVTIKTVKLNNHHRHTSTAESIGSGILASVTTTVSTEPSSCIESQILKDLNHIQSFDPTLEDNIAWMKNIAKEFNLSETAFIWKYHFNNDHCFDGNIHYHIRFYTSNGTEVDLCGHATLAASSVIFHQASKDFKNEDSSSGIERIIFHTNNNVILKAEPNIGIPKMMSVNNNNNQQTLNVVMDFPTKCLSEFEKGTDQFTKVMSMLHEAFFNNTDGSDGNDGGDGSDGSGNTVDSTFNIQDHIHFIGIDEKGDDLLIELSYEGFSNIPRYSEDINFKPMLSLDGYSRGIILCCNVSDDYKTYSETADFMSRFFGPKVGIEEDPVTGSAHCILGPYFSAKLGKGNVVGAQKSLRGGLVECEMKDNNIIQIAGAAVTAMSGNLYL